MKRVLLTFALGLLVNLNSFAMEGSNLDVASSAEPKLNCEGRVANGQPLSTCVENAIEEFPAQPSPQAIPILTSPLNNTVSFQIEDLKENVMVENPFLNLNKDIYCVISDFLDMRSICAILRIKGVHLHSLPIIVRNMHKNYSERGMQFDTVFLKIPHRDWTPWALPEEVYLALHRAYIQALSMKIPTKKPDLEDWSVDDMANIQKRFKILCSAGSLGHQPAMVEAAHMLRNRAYNDVVPLLLDLEPWAIQYDCRRLNRDLVENKALAGFIDKVHHLCDGLPENQVLETMQKQLPGLLEDLIKIENVLVAEANTKGWDSFQHTKEAKAIQILLTEMLVCANKGVMQERPPEKFIKFVHDHHISTPFVNSIIDPDGYGSGDDFDDRSDLGNSLKTSSFNQVLNFTSVEDYAQILMPQIGTGSVVENRRTFTPLQTPEAGVARRLYNDLISVAILLGAQEHVYYQFVGNPAEESIPTFMYHLMLTRLMGQQSCLSQARFKDLFEITTNAIYGYLALHGHAPQPEHDPESLWNLKRYQDILTLGSDSQSNK